MKYDWFITSSRKVKYRIWLIKDLQNDMQKQKWKKIHTGWQVLAAKDGSFSTSCRPKNSKALLPESTAVTAITITKNGKSNEHKKVWIKPYFRNWWIKDVLPWYEKVFSRRSINFLSRLLSSTARTWRGAFATAITPILKLFWGWRIGRRGIGVF